MEGHALARFGDFPAQKPAQLIVRWEKLLLIKLFWTSGVAHPWCTVLTSHFIKYLNLFDLHFQYEYALMPCVLLVRSGIAKKGKP